MEGCKMVEIWKGDPKSSKKQVATAARIVEDLKSKGIKAEVRMKNKEVQVWRDREFEKRLITDYVS